MRYKKIILKKPILIISCLIVFLFVFNTNIVYGEMKQPDFYKGDRWHYRYWAIYEGSNCTDTSILTVNGKTNITVNDEKYYVWEFEEVFTQKVVPSWDCKIYRDVSDLSLRKTEWYRSGQEAYYQEDTPASIWPLKVGEKTYINRTRTVYEDKNYYTKDSARISECIGKQNITTEAGFFNCYIVKDYKQGETDNYRLSLYSPKAGWLVKSDSYSNGEIIISQKLIAYETSKGSGGNIEDIDDEPGFDELPDYTILLIILLIVLIFVLALVFYLYSKFKKNN